MPSVAEAPLSPLNGRKRRRDEGVQMKISSPNIRHHHHHNNTTPDNNGSTAPYDENSHISIPQPAERRYISPKSSFKRVSAHDSKRQRTSSLFSDLYPTTAVIGDQNTRHVPHEPVKKLIDLSPCHICRRKPTVKSELDAFATCEGCAKRTCYVCIRECLGSAAMADVVMGDDGDALHDVSRCADGDWEAKGGGEREIAGAGTAWDLDGRKATGHRGMVCSRCCAERGTEGEVWCLGCLRAEKG